MKTKFSGLQSRCSESMAWHFNSVVIWPNIKENLWQQKQKQEWMGMLKENVHPNYCSGPSKDAPAAGPPTGLHQLHTAEN